MNNKIVGANYHFNKSDELNKLFQPKTSKICLDFVYLLLDWTNRIFKLTTA